MNLKKRLGQNNKLTLAASALLIAASLSACGGGGADDKEGYTALPLQAGNDIATAIPAATEPAPTPATTLDAQTTPATGGSADARQGLLISEVATNYYRDDVAWLEVYNPQSTAVMLSDYALRSSYLDTGTGKSSTRPAEFALPSVAVPPRGYLVIAAGVDDELKDNSQIVYIKKGNLTPFWNANGSVELVRQGASADFVRFGNSTAAPATASAWRGTNVPALPSGADEHGKSIVRLAATGLPDTDSSSDWALVNFATPAGPNDVLPGVVDSDRDGIPDSAKAPGGTYAGLDLYAMGARRGRRDLFVEIDYMKGSDPALTPRREALQKITDTFAEKNIALHLDTGALHGAAFDPAQFNLGGGNAIDFASCVALSAGGSCKPLQDVKSRNFDVRRKLVFHYALFANSLQEDGGPGASGVAEVSGSNLIVALGGNGFSITPGSALNLLSNLQASTLMHELGHNLGLLHGGNESVNYKPNHYSVMNYMYQFAGLSATPYSVNAAERYYLANGMKGKTLCNLVENSPCTTGFKMSYSDGASTDLDENNLLESANIGRGSVPGAYADWNNDNVANAGPYARNINPKQGSGRSVLKDYNEWANLVFPFSRHGSANGYGSALSASTSEPRCNPMNARPRRHSEEQPMPDEIHHMLRLLRALRH